MPMDDAVGKMRDKARLHGDAMLQVLVDIAEDDDQKGSARVAAARTVLERGFGVAERHTTQDVNVNVFDAREAHFEALKKLAAEKPVGAITSLTGRVGKTIEGEATRLPAPAKTEYEE